MLRHILASLAAVIVMLSAAPALADKGGVPNGGNGNGRRHAPEFDIAAVGAVAAILAGGGILLARRRRSS
jgi:LPXTG-motif cell wall-anchored protein